MTSPIIHDFVKKCREEVSDCKDPFKCVETLIPDMLALASRSNEWICEDYLTPDANHYARNPVFLDEDNQLGLYVIVWQPQQWSAVHDHGTWGVVGVLEGSLYEHNFIRCDHQPKESDEGIELVRGGTLLLSTGSVTGFVPNPDHIHMTGNPSSERVVSLHLYGHSMAGFNLYDVDQGSRRWFVAGEEKN